jgi:hypothetical protein
MNIRFFLYSTSASEQLGYGFAIGLLLAVYPGAFDLRVGATLRLGLSQNRKSQFPHRKARKPKRYRMMRSKIPWRVVL